MRVMRRKPADVHLTKGAAMCACHDDRKLSSAELEHVTGGTDSGSTGTVTKTCSACGEDYVATSPSDGDLWPSCRHEEPVCVEFVAPMI